MAKFPALPLWTDALIADTYHLSAAEFGAYVRLLMVAWRRPNCDLPNDDAFLSKSAGDHHNWVRHRKTVMAFFDLGEDDFYTQKRLRREWDYVSRRRGQQSDAGTASALKRKKTTSTDVDPPLQRDGNPHTHTKESKKILALEGSEIEADFEIWYDAYPRKIARAAALKAYRTARKKTDATTLLDAIPVYKKNKPDYADWKYPATWLNGECWKDEAGPSGKTVNKPFSM